MTHSRFNKLFLLTFFFVPFAFTSSSNAEALVGKVTSIHGDVIELNLGSEKGIKSGDSGRVYYTITVAEKEKPIFIAKFRITHLSEKSSMAQIEEMTGEVQVGYLAEIIVKAGELEVKSDPPGAKVSIDGKESGETPLILSDIKRGRHQIRLMKEGYESYEVSVETGVGRKEVMANLKKMIREGGVVVRTEPVGATIYLEGKLVGKSPYEGKELSTGSYSVRVIKEGFQTWEGTVRVEGGQKAELFAKLKEEDWNQRRCEAPVWKVGNKWTYKDATGNTWTNEVVDIKKDVFILRIGASRILVAFDNKTINHKYLLIEGQKEVESNDPRRKLFDFPLFVGKKWTDITHGYPFGDTMKKTGKATYDEGFKIEGVEAVVTAVGTFKAYKICFEHTNRKASQSGLIRYWYSPEAKNWVKSEVEKSTYWFAPWARDAELISYELK